MPTPTYDPTKVITTWAGIAIQGAMGDDWFALTWNEKRTILHNGTQGATAYTLNPNRSAMAKITIDHTSPSNVQLGEAFAADRMGAFLMSDTSLTSRTLVESDDARIEQMAEIKRGTQIVAYEWTFILPKCTVAPGGNA